MRVMGRVVGSVLDRVERKLAWVQGKGFGASTVDHEVETIRAMLADTGPVLQVVDVGANVGDWSAAALATFPAAQVHAFEPSTTCIDRLEKRYANESRFTLTPSALGAAPGSGTLFADTPGSGLASLSKRRLDHIGITMDQEQPVEITTLDDYVAAAGIDRVDILKIDVEGHELDVLRGATTTLATTRLVQFEFGGTQIDTRTFFQDYWYLLTDAGFTIWRIGPWSVRRITRYRETDETFVITNYLAVRTR